MPDPQYEDALEALRYERALAAEQQALEAQMLAEQAGGITAGGGGRSYPDLVGGKVRLQAPEYSYSDLIGRAFRAGTIGSTVGAGLRAVPERSAIRAAGAATSDELFDQMALQSAIDENDAYKNRKMFTRMHPDDFLALAKDFPESGPRRGSIAGIRDAIESGTPLSHIPSLYMEDDGRIFAHEGRHRALAMKHRGFESFPVAITASGTRWDQQSDPTRGEYRETLPTRFGSESPKEGPPHRTRPVPYHTEGPLRGKPLDAPPIRRPLPTRFGSALARFGRAVINPASIATDAAIGGAVGAGSAVAGHASAAPESAGLLSPPGGRFEGLDRPEDVVRVAEALDDEREALRLERLHEVYDKFGFGYVPHTARIDELNEILDGPLAR